MHRHRQRGWAAVVLLVALAIVGYLARDPIARLLMPARIATQTRPPVAERSADGTTQAVAMPATPVERAHAVEDVVGERFERTGQRVDAPR